ncbi:hypothetical protein FKD06_25400 [Serratia sp. SRS-8-S-2018]|uniref:hypothetical protein n=1 Tax=Serratia sp. SRS-8-S-2018 TaxID=2591107 RepID=UPI0011408746|nr:hypothetical protein [Serratia sp. SRS-8-S-2018]TPW38054.1 hypothetical protein FKD06_25400 [Serratia sp. SRS-8-S-2018]
MSEMKSTKILQIKMLLFIIALSMHQAFAQGDIYELRFRISVVDILGYNAVQLTHYRIGLHGVNIALPNQPIIHRDQAARTPVIDTGIRLPTNNRMYTTVALTFRIVSSNPMHIPDRSISISVAQNIEHVVGLNYIARVSGINIFQGLLPEPPTVRVDITNRLVRFRNTERGGGPIFNLDFRQITPAINNGSIIQFILLGSH